MYYSITSEIILTKKAAEENIGIGAYSITDRAASSKGRFSIKAGPYVLRFAAWDSIKIIHENPISDLRTMVETRAFWRENYIPPDWEAGMDPLTLEINYMQFQLNNTKHIFQVRNRIYENELREAGYVFGTIEKNKTYIARGRLPTSKLDNQVLFVNLDGISSASCENGGTLIKLLTNDKKEVLALNSNSMEDAIAVFQEAAAIVAYDHCIETWGRINQVYNDIKNICRTDEQAIELITMYRESRTK